MKVYKPEALVANSRYRNYFPGLSKDIQEKIYSRMEELIEEEKEYCDKGNYSHMAQILTSIAMYEVLQKDGKSFFLPLMKKVVPFGFKKGSGYGWRYTWHKEDAKDRFHFECNECIYEKILGKRGLIKLGAMCCHADIINYGSLPYTDFVRTKTLCQGGDLCDFLFIRHESDAGEGWERSSSI
ncbi:MAG: L-2-amino-thiazoline-4-carboxylic acid hydrolase [Lachnospiraceae bacterium]|nr:L-2-amino-thiazoline-4-carboxylic acid hydrolase [Lachnospiraceae bacterium]